MNQIPGHDRKWPLEQPDGSNAFLDSLADLGNSPLTWHLDERYSGAEVSALIDDLENAYYQAAEPWQPPRPVFGKAMPDESQWLDESFLEKSEREAPLRFWELVTTTRFCVSEPPNIRALNFVHFATETITLTHVASLAAMVCIFNAINKLESVLKYWQQKIKSFHAGRSFDWLLKNDANLLEIILRATALDDPVVLAQYQAQTKEAREACDQAKAWLSTLETLQCQSGEHDRAARNKSIREKEKKSYEARQRASLPRKAPELTQQIAAELMKSKPNKKSKEKYADELGERYGLSGRQFLRRLNGPKK